MSIHINSSVVNIIKKSNMEVIAVELKNTQSFFAGINYWESVHATKMWKEYDEKIIEEDFKVMKKYGITHLRVFPLWSDFQPLYALYANNSLAPYEYCFENDTPLPDTEAGRAGVSEEMCRKFENFCHLAEKHGLRLIVGLITGHMSFRIFSPPAFEGKNFTSDPAALKWQVRFVKYFVSRFKNQKSIIAWDIGNETSVMANLPGADADTFYLYTALIANTAKSVDNSRPVISGNAGYSIASGAANMKDMGEICDIDTTHPYNIFNTSTDPINTLMPILDIPFRCRIGGDIAKIPTFVQEFGSIGYTNCSKKSEADFYRNVYLSCLAHGCGGIMWWCAFDQGQIDFAPYNWNNIGSDYGFFDKDRNPKPIAKENLRLQKKMKSLISKSLPPCKTCGTILIERDGSDHTKKINLLRSTYFLSKRAGLDMNFSYVLDKIEYSPLYILPSVTSNQAITKKKADELLAHVKSGAVLYMSIDNALFRQMNEIFGVEIETRMTVSREHCVNLNGHILPIKSGSELKASALDSSVIACDENSNPVFFRKKYGKGKIFLFTLPIEKYLAEKQGAFYLEDEPDYSEIYKLLAKEAKIKRYVDIKSDFVIATEHDINDKEAYIFAINYSPSGKTCDIKVNVGKLFDEDGNEIKNKLTVSANDAKILKLIK